MIFQARHQIIIQLMMANVVTLNAINSSKERGMQFFMVLASKIHFPQHDKARLSLP